MRLVAMVAVAVAVAAASKLYAEEPAGLVLSETEQALFDETLAKYDAVNPVVGFLAHDMMHAIAPTVRAYLDANAGSRVFGAIAGHMHFAYMVPFGSKASSLESKIHGMPNCFCKHGDTSRESCRLSLFVFDTEKNQLHEIRLAGGDKPNPKYPDRKLRPNRPVDVVSAFDCAR